MNKKTTLLFLVVFLFGTIAGYEIGKLKNKTSSSPDTFQAGWSAAKKRLTETGFYPVTPGEIREVNGEVTAIDDSRITLKIHPFEPLSDPALDARVVSISQDTKIFRLIQKDPQAFQKEMEDFQKNVQSNTLPEGQTPAMPPIPYEKKGVDESAIKNGQNLIITTREDVRNARQFEAVEIDIPQGMPASMPTPAPTPDSLPGDNLAPVTENPAQ